MNTLEKRIERVEATSTPAERRSLALLFQPRQEAPRAEWDVFERKLASVASDAIVVSFVNPEGRP